MRQDPLNSEISIDKKDDGIKDLFVTSCENYAVVTFESGLISIYDVKNGYSLIGDIDD